MSNMTVEQLREIRNAVPGSGLLYCKRAFEQTGNVPDAIEVVRAEMARLNMGHKPTPVGIVHTYTHQNRIGVVIELRCETDFVARTDEFQTLLHETALHIAALGGDVPIGEDILDMPFVKDESKTMRERIQEVSAQTKEHIHLAYLSRHER
jgi:elongation factor Ts